MLYFISYKIITLSINLFLILILWIAFYLIWVIRLKVVTELNNVVGLWLLIVIKVVLVTFTFNVWKLAGNNIVDVLEWEFTLNVGSKVSRVIAFIFAGIGPKSFLIYMDENALITFHVDFMTLVLIFFMIHGRNFHIHF